MEAGIAIMTRVETWPQVLAEFLADADRPFEWGTWDCGLMAANCVQAMTGVDIAAEFRGRYKTAKGARRVMRGAMGEMMTRVAATYGMPEIDIRLAQRGDMVMIETPLGEALGICTGPTVACTGPDGLVFRPMSRALRAWRI
ncbi:hypothetical protein [Thiobacillus sp.]|uniref:DUF6950 family protein n=1 Tax=Thiobacillus sp. TaxID=924 RepID=UPI0017A716E2|nr:hypothetical protein [Thiobacillus sp.]MBC2731386.1 hypothetical protein [Thiobacillus sp.]MBC2740123.1 hypothetical protein [Thiobacillus sp.]MBC2758335.1 hypothetical protein [Thiobacillus sp.]